MLGGDLPAWPEEPEEKGATGGWIHQGRIYAGSLRLWQAQLRNVKALDGTGGVQLTAAAQKLGSGSAWDQSVARYLLADPEDGGTYERTLAAAKLVGSNVGTKAQQLGCALELAKDGHLVCAVEAIKQLFAAQEVSADECLTISAMLVANLPEAEWHQGQDPNSAGELWLENVALHLQATSVLASAVSQCSVEHDRAELLHQLDNLGGLASNNCQAPGSDEYAAIAQAREQERTREQINLLLKENDWLQLIAELDQLANLPSTDVSLRNQIRAAVLSDFAGVATEQAPADYAAVNHLREENCVALIEHWKSGMDVTTRLGKATPLVLVKNFSAARRRIDETPVWIAYGNVRTGTTMVFNLLRIIANSLSPSVINAWEGDLASPQKLLELVNESIGINLGVLKIHRPHDSVNAMLSSRQAVAILSCRDMETSCFSYWRMLHNRRSPFYNSEANLAQLDQFIESQIEDFRAKSLQPNTLIVREKDLRSDTLKSIRRIAVFIGVALEDESLEYLAEFLSPKGMRRLAEDNQKEINSTGHEAVTYLHPGHIAESSSEQQCTANAREYIRALVRKYAAWIDQDGYCKLVDAAD